jgi:hypothetical protein
LHHDETGVRRGCSSGMNREAIELMSDLERYRNLRDLVNDAKTQEVLDGLIAETEHRLRELENTGTSER